MTTMMKLCCYILDFRVSLRSTNISVINTVDFQSLPPPLTTQLEALRLLVEEVFNLVKMRKVIIP